MRLNAPLLISFKSRARMMGAGNPHMRLSTLIVIVFRMRRFYQSEQVVTAFYAFAEEPITSIDIVLRNGEVLTMNPFSEGVYYESYYSDMINLTDYVEEIRGYDEQGQLVADIER